MASPQESTEYMVVSTPHNREAKKVIDYKVYVSIFFVFWKGRSKVMAAGVPFSSTRNATKKHPLCCYI